MRLRIREGPGIVLSAKRALACAKHLFARLPVGCQLYVNSPAVTPAPKEHAAPSPTLSFDTYWSAFGPRRKGNSPQACLAKFAGLSRLPAAGRAAPTPPSICLVLSTIFFKFPHASNLIRARNF